jgi:hypothetical protein
MVMVFVSMMMWSRNAGAQTTIRDVLSFLLTNRTVATGDFVRDEQAAAATGDAIADFLVAEFGTLPISASAGGFVYRLDPSLGVNSRTSDSFGPFFTERALTTGARRLSFAFSYQQTRFSTVDGRDLRDGTLVATAAQLTAEPQPFDVEALTLELRTDTWTFFSNVGVTDRLDVGVAIPVIRLRLDGQRVDTYRGTSFTQAIASGSAVGVGDVILRGKANVFNAGASGLAIGAEARLPTGDETNLLGTGEATLTPRLIGSLDRPRAGLHGNVGVVLGGEVRDIEYRGAVTVAAASRLTLVGELAGRRLKSSGRLTDVISPHPTLQNVNTIRLSTTTEPANKLAVVGGFKWNLSSTWLLTGNALVPLTETGLNARITPTVTLDYSFGR